MKVTFILRNLTDEFFTGNGGSLSGLNNLSDADKFAKLVKLRHDLPACINMKIGTGQFRDRVELNQIMRGACNVTYKIEPRRGYQLATFNIERAAS